MKRFTAILLIVCLLAALPVAAENKTQSLLELVKSRIGDTESYEVFHSSSHTSNGQTMYAFNWEDNDTEIRRSMYVSVTESGIITDYNAYSSEDNSREEKPTLNRVPMEQVQAAAEAFLQKLNPQIANSLTISPRQNGMSLWRTDYRFSIQRMENGVPVYGDTGSMTVAADGKTVTSYYFRYTEGLTFSDPAKAIGREKAEDAYAQKLGMELRYVTKYENKTKTVYPVYQPKAPYDTYIDALTGEAVTPAVAPNGSADKLFVTDMETTENSAAAGATLPMSPAEQAEMANLEGLIPAAEAEKRLRDTAVLTITSDMELTNSSCTKEYYGEQYLYSFQFRSPKQTVSVSMDAKTGQIMSLSRYGELTGVLMSEDTIPSMAQSVAVSLAGDYLKDYRLNEDGCSYTRYANNVPYYDDGISVQIDEKTGQLTWFRLRHSQVEFPSVEGVLTPQQAAEKLFAQVDYSLCYVRDCASQDSKTFDKATLVYRITDSGNLELDPFAGKMEKQETAELPEYTDISGHYGETAITTLRQFGIGFASGEYQPNATITQGEFLQLLQVVFFGTNDGILTEGADYAEAKHTAVNHGVISGDVQLDAPLTRQAAAVLLVRAMGYDAVASLQGIYNCPFSDVTEYVGHISILGAMGVFNGDGKGNFLPEKLLTRADAAVVLFNYLKA